jgi:hypothetical protein
MKLQEAIKSKKPFTNPKLKFWIEIKRNRFVICETEFPICMNLKITFDQTKDGAKNFKAKWNDRLVYITPRAALSDKWVTK